MGRPFGLFLAPCSHPVRRFRPPTARLGGGTSLDMRAGDERFSCGQKDHFPGEGELASVLYLLPLTSLVLAADGSAVAVNQEWALLSAVPGETARGDGWLGAVEPRDQEPLRRLLAGAVAAGKPGSGEFRLTGSGGGQRSLWW